MDKQPRKHQPHWKDTTRTARSQKRTKLDDEWANQISGGRYTTLRKLMTAIHNGDLELAVIVKDVIRTAYDPQYFIAAGIQPPGKKKS